MVSFILFGHSAFAQSQLLTTKGGLIGKENVFMFHKLKHNKPTVGSAAYLYLRV